MAKLNFGGFVAEIGNYIFEAMTHCVPVWFVALMGAVLFTAIGFGVVAAIVQSFAGVEYSVLCASYSQ